MSFFSKLFGGGKPKAPKSPVVPGTRTPWVEWEGGPVEDIPLYPRGGYQDERNALLPDGKRRKWVWAHVFTRQQTKGEHAGQSVIVVRVNGRVVGELAPKYREQYPWIWEHIASGVNMATVRLSAGGTDHGNTIADMTLGAHQYQPMRPHESPTTA